MKLKIMLLAVSAALALAGCNHPDRLAQKTDGTVKVLTESDLLAELSPALRMTERDIHKTVTAAPFGARQSRCVFGVADAVGYFDPQLRLTDAALYDGIAMAYLGTVNGGKVVKVATHNNRRYDKSPLGADEPDWVVMYFPAASVTSDWTKTSADGEPHPEHCRMATKVASN